MDVTLTWTEYQHTPSYMQYHSLPGDEILQVIEKDQYRCLNLHFTDLWAKEYQPVSYLAVFNIIPVRPLPTGPDIALFRDNLVVEDVCYVAYR